MAWTDQFIADLRDPQGRPLLWRVVPALVRSESTYRSDDYAIATAYKMSNGRLLGDPILCGPPSHDGTRVTLGSWSGTVGGWTFEISGDLTRFRQYFTRGTYVEIQAGFDGYDIPSASAAFTNLGQMQLVGFGRVKDVRWGRSGVTLEIADATVVLDSRATKDGDGLTLFDDLLDPPTTYLTSDYTAGDTTLNVGTTGNFKDGEAGTDQVLAFGGLYYLYTGTTATTLTIPATPDFPTGTAADVAADGTENAVVTQVFHLAGHPLELALKILISRVGDGTYGTYDTLPTGWGLGIAERYLDTGDIEAERAAVMRVSSGTYTIDLLEATAVSDPKGWMMGWLNLLGVVATVRQGKLTLRAATLATDRRRGVVGKIVEADVRLTEATGSWWDPGQASEAGDLYVTSALDSASDTSDRVQTLPAVDQVQIDVSGYVFNASSAYILNEILGRLQPFYTRVPEILTLPLAGLHWARVSALDWVTVTLPRVRSDGGLGIGARTRHDYSGGLDCLVLQVRPDWRKGTTTIVVAYHPVSQATWP